MKATEWVAVKLYPQVTYAKPALRITLPKVAKA